MIQKDKYDKEQLKQFCLDCYNKKDFDQFIFGLYEYYVVREYGEEK